MKRFMITAAMAAMLMTTATAYGKVENVMAAASSTTKTTEKKASKATDDKEDKKETTKIEKGDSLTIKTDDLSEDAAFYPIEVDGTEMEVIAVKDAEGIVRTAFNTCQICYDSGNGYYKQEGDKLVCQNCGNSFAWIRSEKQQEDAIHIRSWMMIKQQQRMKYRFPMSS